jgi:LysM repeat protein
MDWNQLDDTLIRIGQRLLVAPLDEPGPVTVAAATPPIRRIVTTNASNGTIAKSPATATGRLIHRVRKGESLSVIADSYKTSVAELRKNNQHLGRILQIGDSVYIPASR